MKKYIGVFILFCSLVSCKQILESANSTGKDDVKLEDLKKITVNENYSIGVPEYMKEMKSLNEEASFAYANVYKETYTIVIDESKQEFIDAFVEMELYDESKPALENYSEVQTSSFRETVENFDIIPVKSKIKNIPSEQYELHCEIDGIKVSYIISFAESKNALYMLMSWTLDTRFKKYEDTFKLIHQTFKLQ